MKNKKEIDYSKLSDKAKNRLSLLTLIDKLALTICDFTKLEPNKDEIKKP